MPNLMEAIKAAATKYTNSPDPLPTTVSGPFGGIALMLAKRAREKRAANAPAAPMEPTQWQAPPMAPTGQMPLPTMPHNPMSDPMAIRRRQAITSALPSGGLRY